MPHKEFHYQWQFELKSSPELLWPLLANTDRFNRDVGLPALQIPNSRPNRLPNARKRIGIRKLGLKVEWEEHPFEWVRPFRFGVRRVYFKGPIKEMRVRVELTQRSDVGTTVNYEIWISPRNWVGRAAIPIQIGALSARSFAATIRHYDEIAQAGKLPPYDVIEATFLSGGKERLKRLAEQLENKQVDRGIVASIISTISAADDFYAARMRPFELADYWNLERKVILAAFLHATRIGMLDLQWDIICPHCRGAKKTFAGLSNIDSETYCQTCNIDFTVDFHRTIELTFRPSASLRKLETPSFCVGGPTLTPHIIAQQLVEAGDTRRLNVPLEAGRYRLRTLELPGAVWIEVDEGNENLATFHATDQGWTETEGSVSPRPSFYLENQTSATQLFILERTSWSDQAATAAEVTSLQVFRDLFSSEALRPGEQISVGTLTVVFTDLRGSTQLYRAIGDAPAFGRVMNHFDVLKALIEKHDGALVKTIGDAVMAVFRRPVNAVRAVANAQHVLADQSRGDSALYLKAGINIGPCIAVTLNERLDYFGGTINMAARLESLSTGHDVIISDSVREDPEVQELLMSADEGFTTIPFSVKLKGFEDDHFDLWRVSQQKTADNNRQ
ncbi:MAG: hypothetical protein QOH96_1939 [Blastocatellia bacterium]|nr:hypothetical protein [Blastocatellia bacterium]